MLLSFVSRPLSRATLTSVILAALLSGCAALDHPGPPHPGAANPYSDGGFHDAGPNYPNTGQ